MRCSSSLVPFRFEDVSICDEVRPRSRNESHPAEAISVGTQGG